MLKGSMKGSEAQGKQPVLRQATLSSFFKSSRRLAAVRPVRHAAVQQPDVPPAIIDLEMNESSSKKSTLFCSQGSFDECDPDEEFKRLVSGPKLNTMKKATITRVPSLLRSNSSVSYSYEKETVSSTQLSFTNEDEVHHNPFKVLD